MVLISVSLIDDVEHLFKGLSATCISSMETSLFRPFAYCFNCDMCLFTIELSEFFIYSEHRPFIIYMTCKFFLLFCGCLFNCLYSNHFLLDNCSFIYHISLFAAIFHLFFCCLFVRLCVYTLLTFSWWLRGKESACQCRRCVWSLGQEDPLEEGMATHSSPLAWKNPMDRGVWQATVHGVTKSHNLVIEHMCTL